MTCFTHNGEGYSEALDYDKLEEPWRERARIARNFAYQLDDQWDREDLKHDIIVTLYEVAEKYHQQGKSLTKWGCIRAAQYERLQFYHKKKRWKRVFSVSLNSTIEDGEGNETELVNTIASKPGVDMDAWLDAKEHYQSSPENVKRAVNNLVVKEWREVSGYDWKLIKRFRTEFRAKLALV